MDYIQSSNKQVDKFGVGKHGFAAGNPTLGVLATYFSNTWADGVQQEILNAIEASGLAASGADLSLLTKAIRRFTGGNFKTVAATGALVFDDAGLVLVNAASGPVTITLPAATVKGLPFTFRRIDSTTNVVTVNRAGADTIDEGATSFTIPGKGTVREIAADGTSSWRSRVASGGRLLGVRVITSTQVYNETAGTNWIDALIVGAGGGGGGASASGAGQASVAGGGGAGAHCRGVFTSGFSGATITIGAAGAGAPGSNVAGAAGGATSIGALMTAPGGGGGPGCGIYAVSGGIFNPGGGGGGTPTGGTLWNGPGERGGNGHATPAGLIGGSGGTSIFGAGAGQTGQNTGGGSAAAQAYGAGGAGGCCGASSGANQSGGYGANGVAIIWEYA